MRSVGFLIFTLLFLGVAASPAQRKMPNSTQIKTVHIPIDFSVSSLDSAHWELAQEVAVKTDWSGAMAPVGRQFKARLLWSDTALYVRFEANQTEPLNINLNPDRSKQTDRLWDRDVCEIFIAPDAKERNKYFEFEVAPTGEWVDLAIEVTPDKRSTDSKYNSGMESAARIDKGRVVMAIKIPFTALGKTPKAGDVWLGNLFRCVGKGATRGYLAWQPTKTKTPNFHVPGAFGGFEFVK